MNVPPAEAVGGNPPDGGVKVPVVDDNGPENLSSSEIRE
jgi:hypothetical protein